MTRSSPRDDQRCRGKTLKGHRCKSYRMLGELYCKAHVEKKGHKLTSTKCRRLVTERRSPSGRIYKRLGKKTEAYAAYHACFRDKLKHGKKQDKIDRDLFTGDVLSDISPGSPLYDKASPKKKKSYNAAARRLKRYKAYAKK